MQSVDWDDLRTFLAVARAGRVAAAARTLGVEHSTVSRRLSKLEADLGAAVFYRTAGGYQLTRAITRTSSDASHPVAANGNSILDKVSLPSYAALAKHLQRG